MVLSTSSEDEDDAPVAVQQSGRKRKKGILSDSSSSSDDEDAAPAAPALAAPAPAPAAAPALAPAPAAHALAGKGVVLMGTLRFPQKKEEATQLCESVGGIIRDAVSGATALLVVIDLGITAGHSRFTKLRGALHHNVPVVSLERLRELVRSPSIALPTRQDARRRREVAWRMVLGLDGDDDDTQGLEIEAYYALHCCDDDENEATAWLDDPQRGGLMRDARVAAEINPAELWSKVDRQSFSPRPWDYQEGDCTGIIVLAEFEEMGPPAARPAAHMTLYYVVDAPMVADYGTGINRRITKEHLATVQRLVAAADTTYRVEGPNRPDRPVGATFEHASGSIDPTGPIARLRRDICAQTGLPFRSTGSHDLDANEGHVTAGLKRHPGPRLATSGHFEGREVFDLPLRLRAIRRPGVRCRENEELTWWCWRAARSMPGTLGLANVVADAPVPINRDNLEDIKGVGPRRAKFLDAFFTGRPTGAEAAAPPREVAAAPAPSRASAVPDPQHLREARLRRFGQPANHPARGTGGADAPLELDESEDE